MGFWSALSVTSEVGVDHAKVGSAPTSDWSLTSSLLWLRTCRDEDIEIT